MSAKSTQAMRDQAIVWMLKLRDMPNDTDTQVAFADWLALNSLHLAAYQEVLAQWAWMEPITLQNFDAREQALRYRPAKVKSVHRRWIAYGSAAVILMGVALFSPYGWYGLSSTYLTAKGEHQIIALSDGSSVELNTDSEIQVRYRFNQRQVDLVRGEAFFNVIHNPERPFLVAVSNLTIHDIGTAFNVYKKNQKVAIAVQEGVVDVNTKLGLRRLNAGQQIAYSNDEGFESLGQVDLDASTAWRQGKLLFRGQRLADVLAEIGRYHDIEIHLPNAKIADLQVSGSFRAEQLDNMLNAVSTLLPVNIKRISEKEVLIEAIAKR
jgi:transmembrane sensor